MYQFDIPVVLFLFKRKDTVLQIIDMVRQVTPEKIYLLSDEGRTSEEKEIVKDVRMSVEHAIDWPCTIVKNYAIENRGVYENIGLGAKWVFEREEKAIFIEDDNLPEITFFQYCKEMLERYEDNSKVLWVCGTNYLGDYACANGASYMFTQHLLPCGWASWSNKFLKYYDFDLELADDPYIMGNLLQSYADKRLYQQQYDRIWEEKLSRDNCGKFCSWDYHMLLTIRAHQLLGISPAKNQIRNIGVDANSIHGGSSMANIMTKRFCGMDSYPLDYPLVHPKTVMIDDDYEKRISNIILMPFQYRLKTYLSTAVKKMLGMSKYDSLSGFFKK